MSFFIRGKNARPNKRKGGNAMNGKLKPGKKQKQLADDEEILSESDEECIDDPKGNRRAVDEEEEEETAQEKKLRLTKKYLEEIERQERERAEENQFDKSVIAERVKEDALEQSGKLRRQVADLYKGVDLSAVQVLKCKDQKLPLTSLCVSPDDKYAFTASKDCSIVKWSIKDGKKISVISGGRKGTDNIHVGHTATVLALAISSDSKFLASGCMNKIIHIWDPETMKLVHTFRGHRDAVSGLAFRKNTHQLFSASFDKSVKIWNLDEMSYVETLLGHQDRITGIDSLMRERAITAGGRDNSIRIWKVVEESQLVYNGHQGSTDCVKFINEEHFITAGDDGTLSLWGTMKKKPLFSVQHAHGINSENGQPNWISSLAALTNTDLIASGSSDGQIKVWKCGENFRFLSLLFTAPVQGFVNSLSFTANGQNLLAAVGQEHRLGRWWRDAKAKNSLVIFPLEKR